MIGIGFLSRNIMKVANNQRCHSLEIIFLDKQQKRDFLMEDDTYLLLVFSMVDQTQCLQMGKG